MGGLGRMSGILYVAFIEMFQVDRLQASIPFSARSLTRNLLGPVVGILGQKYDVRRTTLLGGVIGTLSAVACFYASDMLWITILWGVINGVGAALSMTLPQVVLGKHFKKYRTTASGIAFSGGCVGAFLFPVILEYFLLEYGLGGSFLMMAGLIMNVIPAAMVLREPSWLKKEEQKKIEVSTVLKEFDSKLSEPNVNFQKRECKHRNGNVSNQSDASENFTDDVPGHNHVKLRSRSHNLVNELNIDTQFLRNEQKLVMRLFMRYFVNIGNFKVSLSLSEEYLSKELEQLYVFTDAFMMSESNLHRSMCEPVSTNSSEGANADSEVDCCKLQKASNNNQLTLFSTDLNRSITLSKEFLRSHFRNLISEETSNILGLFHERKHSAILQVMHELRQIHQLLEGKMRNHLTDSTLKEINNGGEEKILEKDSPESSNTFLVHAKSALRLHANPLFLLISLCRSVHFLTFVPAVTVIVDFSMDKGLLQEDGKYVIAALSFGDLFGRICLGWVTDKGYLSLRKYMLLVMTAQGICTASLAIMNSKAGLLALIALFGLLQGSLFVRHPVLVSKYLGKNEQSVAMGCFNFFSGLLGFALPNYIGYFRDTIGSYDGMFYINGGIGTFVGLLWFFEPYFVKCIKSKEKVVNPA